MCLDSIITFSTVLPIGLKLHLYIHAQNAVSVSPLPNLSDASNPWLISTEEKHVVQQDDLTSVKTNICLSVPINEAKYEEITWLTSSEVIYSKINATWNSD